MYRTIAARCSTRSLAIQSRTLHSSPIAFNKTVTEKVKDAADTVRNRNYHRMYHTHICRIG